MRLAQQCATSDVFPTPPLLLAKAIACSSTRHLITVVCSAFHERSGTTRTWRGCPPQRTGYGLVRTSSGPGVAQHRRSHGREVLGALSPIAISQASGQNVRGARARCERCQGVAASPPLIGTGSRPRSTRHDLPPFSPAGLLGWRRGALGRFRARTHRCGGTCDSETGRVDGGHTAATAGIPGKTQHRRPHRAARAGTCCRAGR